MSIENKLSKMNREEVAKYKSEEMVKGVTGGILTYTGVVGGIGAGLGFLAGGLIGSVVGTVAMGVGISPDEINSVREYVFGGSAGAMGGSMVGLIGGAVAGEVSGTIYTIKKFYNAYMANQIIK